MATVQAALTPEVAAFAEREGLHDTLQHALTLVQECFPGTQRVRVEHIVDPESGEQWLTLTATMPGSVERLIVQEDQFLDRWVAAIPWPKVFKVRFALDIV